MSLRPMQMPMLKVSTVKVHLVVISYCGVVTPLTVPPLLSSRLWKSTNLGFISEIAPSEVSSASRHAKLLRVKVIVSGYSSGFAIYSCPISKVLEFNRVSYP